MIKTKRQNHQQKSFEIKLKKIKTQFMM